MLMRTNYDRKAIELRLRNQGPYSAACDDNSVTLTPMTVSKKKTVTKVISLCYSKISLLPKRSKTKRSNQSSNALQRILELQQLVQVIEDEVLRVCDDEVDQAEDGEHRAPDGEVGPRVVECWYCWLERTELLSVGTRWR